MLAAAATSYEMNYIDVSIKAMRAALPKLDEVNELKDRIKALKKMIQKKNNLYITQRKTSIGYDFRGKNN